ncbi:MAG: hypothetical protein IRZ10_00060 [Thermoflavifilum sp.]|nr:hypothetical protein [Thermoflavifilum sp.]MCL6512780.1 hypothetical protein [Alicyclobacillus sp.]
MRRHRFFLLTASLASAMLCIAEPAHHHIFAQQRPQQPTTTQAGFVSAPVSFRVFSGKDWTPVRDAEVVVIGRDGQVLTRGRTDAQGTWRTSLTAPLDPRLPRMGAVTALVVARGYNETVIFDVPVKPDTVQPVTLWPIVPGLRNEPTAVLGNIHRLDVIELVNRYARQLGWVKQAPIPGEQGYAPWGPARP